MYMSYHNYTINFINNSLYDEIENYHQTFILYDEWSIPCLIIGLSIFELFRRIKINPNKIINYIASSVFMIYLIHENYFTRKLFYEIDWIKPYCTNLPLFIGLLLLIVSIVFITGLIIYVLFNLFMKLVDNYCKKYLNT